MCLIILLGFPNSLDITVVFTHAEAFLRCNNGIPIVCLSLHPKFQSRLCSIQPFSSVNVSCSPCSLQVMHRCRKGLSKWTSRLLLYHNCMNSIETTSTNHLNQPINQTLQNIGPNSSQVQRIILTISVYLGQESYRRLQAHPCVGLLKILPECQQLRHKCSLA